LKFGLRKCFLTVSSNDDYQRHRQKEVLMKIGKNSVIQRAPELKVIIRGNRVFLEPRPGIERASNYHALALLDVFGRPRTLENALDQVSSRLTGRWDWINLTAEIKRLVGLGALLVDGQSRARLSFSEARFDDSEIHVRMLRDTIRTKAYQKAIQATVTSNDTVIDIGTGTGVLAATAAKHGAKKIYAVERSSNMAKLSTRFFEENGLADRIEVIEGMSSQVTLPSPADVLITETIGNDPLREGILEICHDAVSRGLVKPDARFIPSTLTLYAIGLEMPEKLIGRLRFTDRDCQEWKELYGLDFSVYTQVSKEAEGFINLGSQVTRDWKRFWDPVELAEFKLGEAAACDIKHSLTSRCLVDGTLNCLLLFFEARLAVNTLLSTHPDRAAPTNSWANPVWVLRDNGLKVSNGENVSVLYKYDSIARMSRFSAKKTPA
jgi:2-polyprenyl-3-methyl-5-hydroxy-6-metoxy-1,4-benzoquinol methylase